VRERSGTFVYDTNKSYFSFSFHRSSSNSNSSSSRVLKKALKLLRKIWSISMMKERKQRAAAYENPLETYYFAIWRRFRRWRAGDGSEMKIEMAI